MTKIILPHSGYKNLIVYKKSDVIYQGTVVFCRRFLPAHGDRTVDQMHAARTEARGEAWDKAVYSMLDLASDSADIEARLAKVIDSARRAAQSIKRRKGW